MHSVRSKARDNLLLINEGAFSIECDLMRLITTMLGNLILSPQEQLKLIYLGYIPWVIAGLGILLILYLLIEYELAEEKKRSVSNDKVKEKRKRKA